MKWLFWILGIYFAINISLLLLMVWFPDEDGVDLQKDAVWGLLFFGGPIIAFGLIIIKLPEYLIALHARRRERHLSKKVEGQLKEQAFVKVQI